MAGTPQNQGPINNQAQAVNSPQQQNVQPQANQIPVPVPQGGSPQTVPLNQSAQQPVSQPQAIQQSTPQAPQATIQQNQVSNQVQQPQQTQNATLQPQVNQSAQAGQINPQQSVPQQTQSSSFQNLVQPGTVEAANDKQSGIPSLNMEDMYEKKKFKLPISPGKIFMILMLLGLGYGGFWAYSNPDSVKAYLNNGYAPEVTSGQFASAPSTWEAEEVRVDEGYLLQTANNPTENFQDIVVGENTITLARNIAQTGDPLWLLFKITENPEPDKTEFTVESVGFSRVMLPKVVYGGLLNTKVLAFLGTPAETPAMSIIQSLFKENTQLVLASKTVELLPGEVVLTNEPDVFLQNVNQEFERFNGADSSVPDSVNDALKSKQDSLENLGEGLGSMEDVLQKSGYDVEIPDKNSFSDAQQDE
ncbi:hypothetical protein KC717_01675 [Candidatus Dojkabacteria bacterium]|uniref:Uncharacterized protein n=1 Tax=Candidatus Dojkabacteria bacterium TaxID=2099670 RepID=A0A955L7C3_9BACT|nr:hypothetical protein [Candidatus Dojkabacteria bacterium]